MGLRHLIAYFDQEVELSLEIVLGCGETGINAKLERCPLGVLPNAEFHLILPRWRHQAGEFALGGFVPFHGSGIGIAHIPHEAVGSRRGWHVRRVVRFGLTGKRPNDFPLGIEKAQGDGLSRLRQGIGHNYAIRRVGAGVQKGSYLVTLRRWVFGKGRGVAQADHIIFARSGGAATTDGRPRAVSRTRREEMSAVLSDVVCELIQGGQIVQNPKRPAMRRDHQVLLFDDQIVNRHHRQVTLHRLP